MELTEGSETSAISIVTPGNYPKENILHVVYTFCLLNYRSHATVTFLFTQKYNRLKRFQAL